VFLLAQMIEGQITPDLKQERPGSGDVLALRRLREAEIRLVRQILGGVGTADNTENDGNQRFAVIQK